jgi:hypothetical protein
MEASMPDEKIDQKRPAHSESELKKMQQRLVDDTVDDSFPASDPPAWTTTGSKSVAARCDPDEATDAASGECREGGEPGLAGQATRFAEQALDRGRRYVADHLPQGQDVLRRGRDTVARPVETYPLTALAVTGAVGFALAWWIYGRNAPYGSRRLRASGGRPGALSAAERRRAEAHLTRSSRAAGAAAAAPDSY